MNKAKRLLVEIIRETTDLQQEIINRAQAFRLFMGQRFRLGEILIRQKIISEPNLLQAMAIQTAGPDTSGAAGPDARNEVTDENSIDGATWFKLILVSVLMGGTAMAGIWFLSGLLLSLFKVLGHY